MEKVHIPPVDEFLEVISNAGGEIYACKLTMEMFKLERDDLVGEVNDVLMVDEFYDLTIF